MKPKGRLPGLRNKKRSRDKDDEITTRRNLSSFELAITANEVEQAEHTAEANAFYGTRSGRGRARGGARRRPTAISGRRGGRRGGRGGGTRGGARGGATPGGGDAGLQGAAGGNTVTAPTVDASPVTTSSERPLRLRNVLPERYRNEILELANIERM